MHKTPRLFSETTLRTDLNELAHSLVRELAMASKKMAIYGVDHPLVGKALEKPFLILGQIFRYKQFVNFNVRRGQLHILNICLKDEIFNAQIMQYLQTQDINALLLERSMTMGQFATFLSGLARRETLYDPNFSLAGFLKKHNTATIQINSELGYDLFEKHKQYRGDVEADFSLKRLVFDRLGTDLPTLAAIPDSTDDMLLALGIDYNRDLVIYLLPERVAALPWQDVRSSLTDLVEQINKADAHQKGAAVERYMSAFKIVEYHPQKDRIIADLSVAFDESGASPAYQKTASATGQIRMQATQRMDYLLDSMFTPSKNSAAQMAEEQEFSDAFQRLLKTGQRDRAFGVLSRVIDHLSAQQSDQRQKALELLVSLIPNIPCITDALVIKGAVETVGSHLAEHRETYEYSEFIWRLFEKAMNDRDYESLISLTTSLADRRQFENGVTVYDSMAVKKALELVSQNTVVDRLVNELTKATFDEANQIKSVLTLIGTESVATGLSQIISHPTRHVRQLSLRVLAELGKSSLRVFSSILNDDAWFERETGRHELADAKWYVVRNSIFVLGSVKDPEGVTPLRLRISDPDVRVRREIVSSLEKIGGEESVDLLSMMAEDNDREIRESAIIAIGLVGSPDSIPMLVDIATRNPGESIRTVAAMGKIGGDQARQYLSYLLEDDQALSHLAGGKVSKDELRLAVVKALGSMGDDESIKKIESYHNNLSAAQKLFFKNSPLLKTISEILARK